MAFTLDTLKKVKDFAPRGTKGLVTSIFKVLPSNPTVFANDAWNKTKGRQWEWKVGKDEYERIAINFGEKAGAKFFATIVGGWKFRFTNSGKKKAAPTGAAETKKQEIASAWIIRAALNRNQPFNTWKDILTYTPKSPLKVDNKAYNTIYEIYPEVGTEWAKVFFAQQKTILDKLSKNHYTEFSRDGGFMKFISKIIKTKFGVGKKDNWNPADIWAVKDQTSVEDIINKTVDGNGSQTILELNAVLRKMFKNETVVGISLKKVSGKVAKWELYNVKELGLEEEIGYNYGAKIPHIDLRWNENKDEFETQDTRYVVEGNQANYDFQIKANTSTKIDNLKFEPTETGFRSARMGKAPVQMVAMLIKDNNKEKMFQNKHANFPKTVKQFNDNKGGDWKEIYRNLKTNGVTMEIKDENEFVSNMTAAFLSKKSKHVANSKCMQMKFLDMVLSMKEKQRNEFMTDMVFLSAKKGKRFGPFGKLY